MLKKATHVKIEELKTDMAHVKNLEVLIGKIIDDTWEEPQGPTSFPETTDLRKWDFTLLKRYKPFYPHATWSFPNLKVDDWILSFETIVSKFGGE